MLEKIREWPAYIADLFLRKDDRDMRSERVEAVQCLLEAIFYRLELSSRYLGTPNTRREPYGFIDESMDGLAKLANLGKRRCERAMRELMQAGVITSKQRRGKGADGSYFGLRAIRQVELKLFELLDMAEFYFAQAAEARGRLWDAANKKGLKSLKKFFLRIGIGEQEKQSEAVPPADLDMVARWNEAVGEIMSREPDKPPEQIRLEANERLGLPAGYHPGAKMK